MGRTLGLPSRYVEEIFRNSQVSSKASCSDLSKNDLVSITDSAQQIIKSVVNGQHDAVIVGKESDRHVYPIRMHTDENIVPVASFEAGLDELFTMRILEYGKESVSEDMDNQISELENTIERQKKAVETVKNKSNEISNLASSLQTLIVRGINSLDDETVQSVLLSANACKISAGRSTDDSNLPKKLQ